MPAKLPLAVLLAILFVGANAAIPPIPGLNHFGEPINVYVGEDAGIKGPSAFIFDTSKYTFNERKTLALTANGTSVDYIIPDQVALINSPQSQTSCFSYTSASVFRSSSASRMGVDVGVFNGALSASADVSHVSKNLAGGTTHFVRCSEIVDRYQLMMAPMVLPFTNEFKKDLELLPADYGGPGSPEYNAFASFTSVYGTHYTATAQMGGIASADFFAQRSLALNQSRNSLELQAQLSFLGAKFAVDANEGFDGNIGVDKSTADRLMITKKLTLVGGDRSTVQVSPGWFAKWAASVSSLPNVVHRMLQPTFRLFPLATQKAYREFLFDYNSAQLQSFQDAISVPLPVPLSQCSIKQVSLYDIESSAVMSAVNVMGYKSKPGDGNRGMEGCIVESTNDVSGSSTVPSGILCVAWVPLVFATQPNKSLVESYFTQKRRLETPSLLPCNPVLHGRVGAPYNLIPGISQLGVALDARTGSLGLPVFNYTYEDKHIIYSSETQEYYLYPDQVYVNRVSGTISAVEKTVVFDSVEDYAIEQASKFGISMDFSGYSGDRITIVPFSASLATMSSYSAFSGSQSKLGITTETFKAHSLRTTAVFSSILSNHFLDAIDNLPSYFSYQRYLEFIKLFGTHVITDADYGGVASLRSIISQSLYSGKTKEELEASLGIHFRNFALGVSWGTSSQAQTIEFAKGSFGTMQYEGGQTGYVLTSQFEEWKKSIYSDPAQIDRSTIPIWELLSDPLKAKFLKIAVLFHLRYDAIGNYNIGTDPSVIRKSQSSASQIFCGAHWEDLCFKKYGWAYDSKDYFVEESLTKRLEWKTGPRASFPIVSFFNKTIPLRSARMHFQMSCPEGLIVSGVSQLSNFGGQKQTDCNYCAAAAPLTCSRLGFYLPKTYPCVPSIWRSKQELLDGVGLASGVEFEGQFVILGGLQSGAKDDVSSVIQSLLPGIGWVESAQLAVPRYGHSSAIVRGRVYTVGGTDRTGAILKSIEILDQNYTNYLSSLRLPEARTLAAVASWKDCILILGGQTASGSTAGGYMLNVTTRDWAPLDVGLDKPLHSASAVVANNVLYIAGGISSQTCDNQLRRYDLLASKSLPSITMPSGFSGSMVLVHTNKRHELAFIGGSCGENDGVITWDIATEKWETLPSTIDSRVQASAAFVQGSIYVAGGIGYQSNPVLSCESYSMLTMCDS